MNTDDITDKTTDTPGDCEPTTFQIAQLAVSLVRQEDDMSDGRAMKRAASLAVSLWNASNEALQNWRKIKVLQGQIQEHQAKVPDAPEWRDIPKEDRPVLEYNRGLEILFPRFRKDQRYGMMLDFLKHLSASAPEGDEIARETWKGLKKDGFGSVDFDKYAALLPHWLSVRRSLVNAENARSRKKGGK